MLLRVTAARTTLVKVLVVVLVPVQTLLLLRADAIAGPHLPATPDAWPIPGPCA